MRTGMNRGWIITLLLFVAAAAHARGPVRASEGNTRGWQLMTPEENPFIYGFSPKPTPKLIATFPLKGEALALSKGIDRDRAVDESGNQIAVFNRRGARPFNLEEMQRMYMQDGQVYTVSNDPPPRPKKPAGTAQLQEMGARLAEAFSTLWAQVTLGLLSAGGAVFMLQRRRGSVRGADNRRRE